MRDPEQVGFERTGRSKRVTRTRRSRWTFFVIHVRACVIEPAPFVFSRVLRHIRSFETVDSRYSTLSWNYGKRNWQSKLEYKIFPSLLIPNRETSERKYFLYLSTKKLRFFFGFSFLFFLPSVDDIRETALEWLKIYKKKQFPIHAFVCEEILFSKTMNKYINILYNIYTYI